MSEFKQRRCRECGVGQVRLLARPGRRTPHRNMANLSVPADLEIPTCDQCGTEWFDEATAQRVDAALEPIYREELRHRVRKAIVVISACISQQRLEAMLGLSQGYLSKLKSGDRDPSPELVSELALIARDPQGRVRELLDFWGHTEDEVG